jgi:hypothetical protein
MSVENTTGAQPTATASAGNGSPANEPSISIEDLTAKVAEQLLPRLSQEITGASKRHTASLKEEIQAMLKGNADAPKDGEHKGKQDKVDPRDLELTKLREELTAVRKEQDRALRDARDGAIAKTLADYEALQGKKATPSGREFATMALSAAAQRMEDGNWAVKEGESAKTLTDYVASFFTARPDLLASSARAGTGATGSKGAQPPPSDMPKTKADVRWTITKDPITGQTKRTPRGLNYVKEFQRQYPEVWSALPDGVL